MNKCGACREDFDSIAAFDAHRVGTHDYTFREGLEFEPPRDDGRRCLDTEELEAIGWKRNRWGRWKMPNALEPHLVERVSL